MSNTTSTTNVVNAGTRWTRDDVRDLDALIEMRATNDEIAYILGRSILAVATAKRDHDERERASRNVTTRTTTATRATHARPAIVGAICPTCFVATPAATNTCESCA